MTAPAVVEIKVKRQGDESYALWRFNDGRCLVWRPIGLRAALRGIRDGFVRLPRSRNLFPCIKAADDAV